MCSVCALTNQSWDQASTSARAHLCMRFRCTYMGIGVHMRDQTPQWFVYDYHGLHFEFPWINLRVQTSDRFRVCIHKNIRETDLFASAWTLWTVLSKVIDRAFKFSDSESYKVVSITTLQHDDNTNKTKQNVVHWLALCHQFILCKWSPCHYTFLPFVMQIHQFDRYLLCATLCAMSFLFLLSTIDFFFAKLFFRFFSFFLCKGKLNTNISIFILNGIFLALRPYLKRMICFSCDCFERKTKFGRKLTRFLVA